MRAFLLLCIITLTCYSSPHRIAVIGAGPAGIITVAVLLEHGVNPKHIDWIDPEFKVGRLGKYYSNVPSNQKAYRFTEFLTKCSLFRQFNFASIEAIRNYNQQEEPPLQLIIDFLQDTTRYLLNQVTTYQDTAQALTQENIQDATLWAITLADKTVCAHKVILATGSHPKELSHQSFEEIPLDLALDENKLKSLVDLSRPVIVMGSAHSALLVVKYLYDLSAQKIINIYTKPPIYGMDGGLEGITARWTQEVLEKNLPANIQRVSYYPDVLDKYQNIQAQIIYAFGYEPNLLLVNNATVSTYNAETGTILPNLYGIGIAFPEKYAGENGEIFSAVGVNSFIERAQELVPQWTLIIS